MLNAVRIMGINKMDKEQILSLLHELGDELAEEESYATINVCGGAAMAIAYFNNHLTDDIDITLNSENKAIFYKIVSDIAKKYNLPEWWIKDDVEEIVNSMKEMCFKNFGKFGDLSIRIISEEQLLAMKLFAARENKDLDDAVILAKLLNITTKEELNNILYTYFNERSVNFMAKRQRRDNYAEIFQELVVDKLNAD